MKRAIVSVLIVTAAAIVVGYLVREEHAKQNHAIELILGGPNISGLLQANKEIAPLIATQFRDYKTNSIFWSLAYHTALFGSALLSVLAGLILKLETWPKEWQDKERKDCAAALAAFSALMVTVSTAGDFHGKWQSTRMAAAQSAALAFDLLKAEGKVSSSAVDDLRAIFLDQNRVIVGESPNGPLKGVDKTRTDSTATESAASGRSATDKAVSGSAGADPRASSSSASEVKRDAGKNK